MACRKDQTIQVGSGMTNAPQVSMTDVEEVEWTCGALNPITVTVPDTKPGDPPYKGSNPFPNMQQVNAYTWDSCAVTANWSSPVPYSVTFPTNSKKIYGHIIIIKPVKR